MSEVTTKPIKDEIYEFVTRRNGGVSFVELERVTGFKGDLAFGYHDMNIILWPRCSLEAVKAIKELVKEEKIVLKGANPFVYIIDGAMPKLPIAKKVRAYKTERWLPTIINLPNKRPGGHDHE